MTKRCLYEDRLPQKLSVIFSPKITKQIIDIDAYNSNNTNGLSQWHDYLDGMKSYISNPVIAWDYTNRHQRFPNGTMFISDFDYNIGYTIKSNNTTQQQYVYVFMANLKPNEFGLKIPQMLKESIQNNDSVKKVQSLIERIENL